MLQLSPGCQHGRCDEKHKIWYKKMIEIRQKVLTGFYKSLYLVMGQISELGCPAKSPIFLNPVLARIFFRLSAKGADLINQPSTFLDRGAIQETI